MPFLCTVKNNVFSNLEHGGCAHVRLCGSVWWRLLGQVKFLPFPAILFEISHLLFQFPAILFEICLFV